MKNNLAHYDSVQELLGDLEYKFNVMMDEFWRMHPNMGEQNIPWNWTAGHTAGGFADAMKRRGYEDLLKPLPPPTASPTQMPLPFFI